MKKLFLITLSTLISVICFSQIVRTVPSGMSLQPSGSLTTFSRLGGVVYPVVGYAPALYTDTAAANANPFIRFIPLFQIGTLNGKNWYRNITTTAWVEMGSESSSGTVTSISNGYGIINTPNPIATTGTIKFDSATVFPQLRATIPTSTLQTVTNNGNTTTNWITVGADSVPKGKVYVVTKNLLYPNDSSGVFLDNPTLVLDTSAKSQYSPALTFKGQVYATAFGGSYKVDRWRMFSDHKISKFGGTTYANSSTFHIQQSSYYNNTYPDTAGYRDLITLTEDGSMALINKYASDIPAYNYGTRYGTINNVQIGSNGLALWYGLQPVGLDTNYSNGGNVAFGYNMGNLKTGSYNTAVGSYALTFDTSGSMNTAVGYYAMHNNSNGSINAAFGMNALQANLTGIKNTAIGAGAMENNTTGSFNVAVGQDALLNNTTGFRNIGIGWNAKSGDSSYHNIMIGYGTGFSLTTGNHDNVFIGGFGAGWSGSQKGDVTYSIALGSGAYTTANNQFTISDNILRFTLPGVSRGVANYVLTDSLGNGQYWVARNPSLLVPASTLQHTFDTEIGGSNLTKIDSINLLNNNGLHIGTKAYGFFEIKDDSSTNKGSIVLSPTINGAGIYLNATNGARYDNISFGIDDTSRYSLGYDNGDGFGGHGYIDIRNAVGGQLSLEQSGSSFAQFITSANTATNYTGVATTWLGIGSGRVKIGGSAFYTSHKLENYGSTWFGDSILTKDGILPVSSSFSDSVFVRDNSTGLTKLRAQADIVSSGTIPISSLTAALNNNTVNGAHKSFNIDSLSSFEFNSKTNVGGQIGKAYIQGLGQWDDGNFGITLLSKIDTDTFGILKVGAGISLKSSVAVTLQETGGGKVGIGTSTPSALLHLVSPVTFGATTTSGSVFEFNSLTSGTGMYIGSTSTASSGATQKLLNVSSSGANASSGITTYSGHFQNTHTGTTSNNYGVQSSVSGGANTNYGIATDVTGSSGVANYGLYSNVNVSGATTTTGAEISSQGGTTNYGVKITANSSASTNSYGVYSSAAATATNNIAGYFSATNGTGSNYALIVPSGGGSVGIGTSTPDSLLHVKLGAHFERGIKAENTPSFADTTNFKPLVINTTGSAGTIGTVYKATYWPGGGGASGLTIGTTTIANSVSGSILYDSSGVLSRNDNFYWDRANGRLGIGTNTPTQRLELNGKMRLRGTAASADYLEFYDDATGSANFLIYVTQNSGGGQYDYALYNQRTGALPYYVEENTGNTMINGSLGNSPNATLQIVGSLSTAYVAKTANYTATISDNTIDFTANADTLTLPTAVGISGRYYTVVNSGSSACAVTTTSSQTFTNINATPTILILGAVGAGAITSYTMKSNGANWVVVNKVKNE